MRYFNSISKEYIGHNEEINIGSMGWDDNQRAIILLVMVSQFHNGCLINNYLLIYCSKNLMQKPSKSSNGAH